MASIKQINNKLSAVSASAGLGNVQTKSDAIASEVKALNSSSLGGLANEVISGVQALNTTTNPLHTIALLTENLTGLKDQIVKDVSSSKTDLDKITGASVDNGFLDLVVASATAQSVQNAINQIATPSNAQLKTIIENVTPAQFNSQVAKIVETDFNGLASELSSAASQFTTQFNALLQNNTASILQDIILDADIKPLAEIENLGVPSNRTEEVFNLLVQGKVNAAAVLASPLTGKSVEVLEIELAKVTTSMADQIVNRDVGATAQTTFDVQSKNNQWNGKATTDDFFDVIATQEQLQIEFIKTAREITEIVFYGYDMSSNQVLQAQHIHNDAIQNGDDGIPYHLVILPNGNVQRGRPFSRDGGFSELHKKYSIGVVVPRIVGKNGTVEQGRSAKVIIDTFHEVWPGGQVWDAYQDLGESKVYVGLQIADLIGNKKNFSSATASSNTSQLINASQGDV